MPLEARIDRIDTQTAVVSLSGPMTLGTNLKTLDAQVLTLLNSGVVRLAFDLTCAPYVDSAGLGTLVHTAGLVAQRGGVLRLAGVSGRVMEMFAMTRTEALFAIDPDLATSRSVLATGPAV